MKRYIIEGKRRLSGSVEIVGSKNVATKAMIAACLTNETVEIRNVPLIEDFYTAAKIIKSIGGEVHINDHTVKITVKEIKNTTIPIEFGAKTRASSMFLAPLLARSKKAIIPNPGGCRIGERPIDRHIGGLEKLGAKISYDSHDGNFYASTVQLKGADVLFEKNTHTGTETIILAAVLAQGTTVIKNASQEPEVDDLIDLLSRMGGNIRRDGRVITIVGVERLGGAVFNIMPDRNEAVTFAVLSAISGGRIIVKNAPISQMQAFLESFKSVGGDWEKKDGGIRFFIGEKKRPIDIITAPHPGFMTDWQGPWAILMTQIQGKSSIHETVYENRFAYVDELKKMGADISFYSPEVKNPEEFYNFNCDASGPRQSQAIKISGQTDLHNAVLTIQDLRAGATLVLAALIAEGKSIIYGVEHITRGYEDFDKRINALGGSIRLLNGE